MLRQAWSLIELASCKRSFAPLATWVPIPLVSGLSTESCGNIEPNARRVGKPELGTASGRTDGREQYGNNLGRKPSQMIPNNPKPVLSNVFRINRVR